MHINNYYNYQILYFDQKKKRKKIILYIKLFNALYGLSTGFNYYG